MRGRTEKRVCKKSETDSEITVCDVCGQNHSTESCIFISARPCTVEDAVTPTHARLTLPANLAVKDLADGSTTVVTKAKFARGTRFGPFIAPLTSILPPEVNFPLKIFGDSEEDTLYLDTRNEDDCNWMCLVGSVSSSNDAQNLLCYQVHDKIFFSLLHDVEPGEELRVWYAPFYGIKMGISPGRLASNSSAASEALEMSEELTKIEEIVTWEADTTTVDILPGEEESLSKTHSRDEKKHHFNDGVQEQRKMLIDDEARTAFIAQQLPPKRLGARFTPACWRCRECGAKEESVISYARHLMRHLKPHSKKVAFSNKARKYSCSICNQKFFSQGLLDDHKATQHDLSDLMEPIPLRGEFAETSGEPDDPLPMEECSEEETQPSESSNIFEKPSGSLCEKTSESESFLTPSCVQQTMDPLPRNTTYIQENPSLNGNMVMNCDSVLVTRNDTQDIPTSRSLTTDLVPMKPSVTFQENAEKLDENSRKLVAVMGENTLQNLLIPIDQQKDIDLLLQSFQQPAREKPVTQPARVPETILNHEFFTRVAGDTVVRDVKSLLSMGYSLQFLVENEDGSSSLVDVLSTGNGITNNSATSGASQNGEVTSQQLVIMANGNVPDSLPQALQGILPSSVPIMPSVVDPIVTPQSPLLADPPADRVTHDNSAADDVQLSCLDSEDSFLNKGNPTSDARSPLGTLLPSAITSNMCYDNVVPYNDSNSENASLMEMSLSGENLEREELDYELGALELPLAVDDTNSTDYMMNACTSSPPTDSVRCTNMCVASNSDLNTPVKMLDQCIESTLSSDVMAFDFEASSHVPRTNMLRSPRHEERNSVCREELTKDFSDLIAADAESSNVMLTIQPADSTAELRKDDSVCSVELRNDNEKGKSTLEWMRSEGLLLPVHHDSVENVPQTLSLNAREHSSISFQPVTGTEKDTSLLKDNSEETRLLQATSEINAELDGLLLDANSNSQNGVPTIEELQRNLEPQLQIQSKEQVQTQSELHLQLHQPQGTPETQFHQQVHTQVLPQAESQHWLSTHTKISTQVVDSHTHYQPHTLSHKQNEASKQVQMKTDTEVGAQIELQIQVQNIADIQSPHQPVSEGHSSPDLTALVDTEVEEEQSYISTVSGNPSW
ncbi:PR domain zinc finger protein 15 [Gryllus bimaculatus]|nr:PR domain zinc finger protein 15 [Gryllus bimaculatus]